jgi:hypothetical protein
MVESGLEASLLHQGRDVEQRARGGGHGDPGTGLDVGGHEVAAAMHGGVVRLRVPARSAMAPSFGTRAMPADNNEGV